MRAKFSGQEFKTSGQLPEHEHMHAYVHTEHTYANKNKNRVAAPRGWKIFKKTPG